MNATDNLCPYVLLFKAKSGDRYVCTLKGKHVTRTHKCKYAVKRRSQSRL